MTIDPINLTLDNAKVTLTGNGLSGYYAGGLGCYGVGSYGGTLTMKSSTLIASENVGGTDGFGAYVGVLDMDAASTVIASNNSGSGLCIGNSRGDESHIYGQIYCEGNGKSGWPGGGSFVVHAQHDDDTYEGNVTIEPGAYLYARHNKALAGVLNEWILNIESGATVIADHNEQFGLETVLMLVLPLKAVPMSPQTTICMASTTMQAVAICQQQQAFSSLRAAHMSLQTIIGPAASSTPSTTTSDTLRMTTLRFRQCRRFC